MLIHLQRDFLVALYARLNLTFVEETFRGVLPPAQTFAARKDEANSDEAIGPTTEVRDPTFGEENVMSSTLRYSLFPVIPASDRRSSILSAQWHCF